MRAVAAAAADALREPIGYDQRKHHSRLVRSHAFAEVAKQLGIAHDELERHVGRELEDTLSEQHRAELARFEEVLTAKVLARVVAKVKGAA
jgi:hypothetical protein